MNPTLFTTDYSGDEPKRRSSVRLVKRLIKGGIAFGFGLVLIVLLCNWWVVNSTEGQIYFNLQRLPANDVGLVLGTSKFVRSGKENLFFRYRMEATALLWKEGKIKYIILSGNNDSEYYNEPADMMRALRRLGVPEDVLILDYAGYRDVRLGCPVQGGFSQRQNHHYFAELPQCPRPVHRQPRGH